MPALYPLCFGLFGIGLDTYWPQFKGLKPRLEGYVRSVQKKLERPGVEVVNLGLIDNPKKALAASHTFCAADVDVTFLHVTTYALSSTVLPVVQRAKVPVVILNLVPAATIDYATFNKHGRPHQNDGRMAGALRHLSRARDRQRLQSRRH
jgi:L-arabinose isomerase